MADRFYINCPLAPGPVVLQGSEAHHLTSVCRIRSGDAVCLFNGDGREYPAQVLAADRRSVTLEVSAPSTPVRELPFAVEVAAPLPKGDRAQFLLEKLTELGVTRFVPLQTRRSVVHPGEAKLEKLRRYVIEACKQCGRNILIQVEPLANWETYCRVETLPTLKILAHPGAEGVQQEVERTGESAPDRKTSLGGWEPAVPSFFPFSLLRSPCNVALAVGPEGGFTAEEVAVARTSGWQVHDLGPRILRVETAALVLAAWAGLSASVGRQPPDTHPYQAVTPPARQPDLEQELEELRQEQAD